MTADQPVPQYVGYICAGIAGFFFGSNFIPVKKFETGNGIYFQWILCTAILMCGFVVNVIRNFPPFQPLAMLGGFLWCTGNMMTVPIIQLIGLGLGGVLWGTANLLVGWSAGAFGILGVHQQPLGHIPGLNYLGAILALASAIIFSFIKPELKDKIEIRDMVREEDHKKEWIELSELQKRLLGITMCLLAGLFYGTNFNPPQYVMDHCPTCSQNGLDYVFSHFTGLYLTSTLYFLIYCVFSKNQPRVYPEVTFPAFISGIMWATAQICWFVANSALALVVSYPLITVMPTVVQNFWGIVVFKEISGRRNFFFFGLAYLFSFASITCTVLAKVL